jgi:PKD repeat protein
VKKYIIGLLSILLLNSILYGQVICVQCFNQNDSISPNVHNFIQNGSFETVTYLPGSTSIGFCPKSIWYGCNISDWICSGGGIGTYASPSDSTFSTVVNGNQAVYFGNSFCNLCSTIQNDTTCLEDSLCRVIGIPTGYPKSNVVCGNDTGLSLEQQVFGLVPGNIYVLEFWAGGEVDGNNYSKPGIFAVDVGFGNIFLKNNPTPLFGIGLGTRYLIQFNATSSTHLIKFTNWGHICSTCTELVLDDVKLYNLNELSTFVAPCITLQSPVANFSSSDNWICIKGDINFYDLSTNNPTSWQWLFPGAIPNSSTMQNPIEIHYPNIGVYDVTLTACNGSNCSALTYSAFIIETGPISPPVVTNNFDTLCVIQFSSYQWTEVSNSMNVLSTDQCFVPIDSGVYVVTVSDSNGCTATSDSIEVITGIEQMNNKSEVNLNFNTLLNEITITVNSKEITKFILFDINSQILLTQNFIKSSVFNINQEKNGIYYYLLMNKNGILSRGKLIKV